jgi:benzoyl-CoA reductase subunit BamC
MQLPKRVHEKREETSFRGRIVTVEKKKKKVKSIIVDVDKCNGCRACEVICSSFHSAPKYSSNNPARSRIRVIHEPLKDIYVPVYAGHYTPAECAGRGKYIIEGKEYDECAFCRASCPSRDLFMEPDSGLPLKCDMCEGEEEPLCVQWCIADALVCEEREEEEEERPEDLEIGLESLAGKYGLDKILDAVVRMAKKKKG